VKLLRAVVQAGRLSGPDGRRRFTCVKAWQSANGRHVSTGLQVTAAA